MLSAALSCYLKQSCRPRGQLFCKTYATEVYVLTLEDRSVQVCSVPNKSWLRAEEVTSGRADSAA